MPAGQTTRLASFLRNSINMTIFAAESVTRQTKQKKEETIHNFTQREVKDCDYENLEKQLLKKQLGDDIVYG